MKFEMTEEQLNNLLVFMERVDLKGNETYQFIEIVESLKKQYEMKNQEIEHVEVEAE